MTRPGSEVGGPVRYRVQKRVSCACAADWQPPQPAGSPPVKGHLHALEQDSHTTPGEVAVSQQPTDGTAAAWRKDRPESADLSSKGRPISPSPIISHTLPPQAAIGVPPALFTWGIPAARIRVHVLLPAAGRYSLMPGHAAPPLAHPRDQRIRLVAVAGDGRDEAPGANGDLVPGLRAVAGHHQQHVLAPTAERRMPGDDLRRRRRHAKGPSRQPRRRRWAWVTRSAGHPRLKPRSPHPREPASTGSPPATAIRAWRSPLTATRPALPRSPYETPVPPTGCTTVRPRRRPRSRRWPQELACLAREGGSPSGQSRTKPAHRGTALSPGTASSR